MPLGHLFGHSPNLPILVTVSYLVLPNLNYNHNPALWAKRLWSLERIRVGHLDLYFSVLLNSCRVWWYYICFWISVWLQRVGHTSRFKYFEVGNINCMLKMRWNNSILPTSIPLWGARGCLSESHLWIFFPMLHCSHSFLTFWTVTAS